VGTGTPSEWLLPEEVSLFFEYVPTGSAAGPQGVQTDRGLEQHAKDCGLSADQVADLFSFTLEPSLPPPKRRKVSWADPIAVYYVPHYPEFDAPAFDDDPVGAELEAKGRKLDPAVDDTSKCPLKRPEALDVSPMPPPLPDYDGRHTIIVRGPSFADIISRLPVPLFRRSLLNDTDTGYTGQRHYQQ